MPVPVNLQQKFDQLDKPWVPKVVGEMAGQYVKVAKFDGEYVWHKHEHEDEMFLVIDGEISIHLRDGEVRLRAGEFFIVPKGVEHKPQARGSANVLLFEPATTRNTGNVETELTIEPENLERL